jgi:opacity protein-like surface antigen
LVASLDNEQLQPKRRNNMVRNSFLAAAVVLSSAATGLAADPSERGFYGSTDVGVSMVEDVELKSIGGLGLGNAEVEFDPGVRLNLDAGYVFNSFLSAGVETGVAYNAFDRLSGPGGSAEIDGDLFQVPLLGTVTVRFTNPSRFVPFIGAGLGAVYSRAVLDSFNTGVPGGAIRESSGDAFDWAWQGTAGVKFHYSDRADVGLVYRYLAVDSPEWEFRGTKTKLDDLATHSLSLLFSYRF